jgi:hypothetical protein
MRPASQPSPLPTVQTLAIMCKAGAASQAQGGKAIARRHVTSDHSGDQALTRPLQAWAFQRALTPGLCDGQTVGLRQHR